MEQVDIEKLVSEIRTRHQLDAQRLVDLYGLTERVFTKLPEAQGADVTKGLLWVVAGLLAKSLKQARSVHVLCANGEGEAALIVGRAMVETWTYLVFVTKPRFRLKRKSLNKRPFPPAGTKWTRGFRALLYTRRVEVAEARHIAKLESERGYKRMFRANARAIALRRARHSSDLGQAWTEILWNEGGCTCVGVPFRELFEAVLAPVHSVLRLVYPATSAIVHAHDINYYVEPLDDGPINVKAAPSFNLLPRAFNTAASTLLGACDSVNRNLKLGLDTEVATLRDRMIIEVRKYADGVKAARRATGGSRA